MRKMSCYVNRDHEKIWKGNSSSPFCAQLLVNIYVTFRLFQPGTRVNGRGVVSICHVVRVVVFFGQHFHSFVRQQHGNGEIIESTATMTPSKVIQIPKWLLFLSDNNFARIIVEAKMRKSPRSRLMLSNFPFPLLFLLFIYSLMARWQHFIIIIVLLSSVFIIAHIW